MDKPNNINDYSKNDNSNSADVPQGNTPFRILFVEDDLVDRKALERYLKGISGFCTHDIADSLSAAKNLLNNNNYDIVVSDHSLGDGTAFDVLDCLNGIPLIVMTGVGDEQLAVEMMKKGVSDYLIKDTDGLYLKKLPAAITNAIDKKRNEDELLKYRLKLEELVKERTVELEKKVTDLEEAEKKISKARDFYHSLLHKFPSLIWKCDPDGKCDYFNQTWLNFTGKTLQQEIGMGWAEGVHPEDYDRCVGNFLSALDKKEPFELEYRLKRYDGSYRWIIDFGVPYDDFDGNFAGYIGSCYDISDTKEVLREIIHARKKAEESSTLKTVLLSNMSHEFRTPMNGILGYADILLSLINDKQQHDMLLKVKQTGNRLMATLNSVLELSQLTSQDYQLNAQPVYLNKALLPVVKKYTRAAKDKGLNFIFASADEDVKVYATEELVAQITENLLDNAIKFTEKGSVTLETGYGSGKESKTGFIKVSDTGIGIAPEHRDIIFEEFRQASEGYGRSFEGTGLGLTLTKKIIDKLNGKINVESSRYKGSQFFVELPALFSIDPDADRKQEREISIKDNSMNKANDLPPILAVEDNDVNRDILRLYLEDLCRITMASNGMEAVKYAEENAYRAILMDINLGLGIDGVETTKRIRKIHGYQDTPVVAVTGYALQNDKEKLLNEGLTHYLAKPFDQEQIVTLLKQILDAP